MALFLLEREAEVLKQGTAFSVVDRVVTTAMSVPRGRSILRADDLHAAPVPAAFPPTQLITQSGWSIRLLHNAETHR
ncbi:hypothetical protein [Nocardia amamiensis]|uniref:hypothetical protein n=1 Tax=Nocardia amamiensis TaxID=404578 RepID=UPI00157DCE15|nr:hypothetical protein [Nocardia amamiensis]